MSRYKEYYSTWNDRSPSEQLVLASVIAKNILNRDKPVLDARITFSISTDLLLTLTSLKKIDRSAAG